MTEHDEQADLAPEEYASGPGSMTRLTGLTGPRSTPWGDGWEAPATGVSAVDDVLASVQALDRRPVEEHVAVFEQAHDRLRRALDPGHG